ncbi:MAG: helical backbone metal receptor [Oligoflexia bacterium]|nr:helical backbone metal receptor [Oligoflexia bacterium]
MTLKRPHLWSCKWIGVQLVALLMAAFGAAADTFDCTRMISLAPSITESLYALGLGTEVVAVTRYDKYPEEVSALPRIGGYLDPNLEAIASFRPGLIVALREQADLAAKLRQLGLVLQSVDHSSLQGILDGLSALGARCNRRAEAARLVGQLQSSISEFRKAAMALPRQRTLVVVGNGAVDSLNNLFISGRDGFYSELLEICGGENVFKSTTGSLLGLSNEGLVTLAPDTILVISDGGVSAAVDRHKLLDAWSKFSTVPAVKSGRVFLLDADYASIPGPRFPSLMADIFHALHGSEGKL